MMISDEGALMDQVLLSLRWWGPYQRVQFLLTMLPVLACAFHTMSVVFVGRAIEHRCAPVDSLNVTVQQHGVWHTFDVMEQQSHINLTVSYEACSIDVKNGSDTLLSTTCINGYLYAEPVDRSFVSQWDLVCERESLSDVSQTVLALGMMVGAFFFTALADRFGRKPIYMLTNSLMFIVATAIAFSPSFTVFVILKFFLGALQQGIALTSTIMLVELLPTKRRSLPSEVGNFCWTGSLMILCLIAYLTSEVSWRYTQLAFAASSAYAVAQWWLTDESLRWLVNNKRQKEIERVLKKAARANKVEFTKILEILTQGQSSLALKSTDIFTVSGDIQVTTPGHAQFSDKNVTNGCTGNSVAADSKMATKKDVRLSTFVTNKRILMITTISCYMWLADSITYYGLLMMSSSLADNLYLGVFLSVLAELPTGVLFIFFINRLGRKRGLIISHIIAAFSLIVATVLSNLSAADNIPGVKIIILSVTLLGKFGVSTSFAILWLYSSELFPTNLRNTGFGICSLAARVGGMVAPYSRTFSRHVPWGPGAVFSGLCIFVPVLIRFLPETTGQELPQTLEDVEKWFEPPKKEKESEKKT